MLLDQYMREHGFTQVALAEKAGLTQPCISRIQRRKRRPTLEVARKLEAATGIPAEQFIFDGPDPKPRSAPKRSRKARAK